MKTEPLSDEEKALLRAVCESDSCVPWRKGDVLALLDEIEALKAERDALEEREEDRRQDAMERDLMD